MFPIRACNCGDSGQSECGHDSGVQVLTSNFNAGELKGPILINSIAKSGGHDYHGLVGFSARNYALNANRWVNNLHGHRQAQKTSFIIGGTNRGPRLCSLIRISNRNRDKLFFFSGFEYFLPDAGYRGCSGNRPTDGMRNAISVPRNWQNWEQRQPWRGPHLSLTRVLR